MNKEKLREMEDIHKELLMIPPIAPFWCVF